jgi:hypothetical protein
VSGDGEEKEYRPTCRQRDEMMDKTEFPLKIFRMTKDKKKWIPADNLWE